MKYKGNISLNIGLYLGSAFIIFFISGLFQAAEAALCPGSTNGVVVSVVYCTRALITDVLTGNGASGGMVNMKGGGYLGNIIHHMLPYEGAAIVLAVTLFGTKLVTMGVQETLKEGAALTFRAGLVIYLLANMNTASFYHSGTGDGIYGALADGMGELVAFVSTAFTKTIPGCNPAIPVGANVAEYKVWGEFDCLFEAMFGLAAPGAIGVGILAMAGAALISAPVGVAILMLAITLFVEIFFTLAKGIYTLLLSYLVLAFLCVISPVLIPLLVFDNGFTRDVFWKWVGMVCSTIFQPLFIIGFLAFFVMVENEFVNGNLASCQLNNSAGPYASACSFSQMLNYCNSVGGCIQMKPIFNLQFNIRWTPSCPLWMKLIGLCAIIHFISDVVNWLAGIAEAIMKWVFDMMFLIPKIVQIPIMTLLISFVSFVFITFMLRDLLNVIPHMAREMTLSVGVGIFQLAQVPLEAAVKKAVQEGGQAMQFAAGQAKMAGKSGAGSMPGVVGQGAKGAAGSILRSLLK